MTNKIQLVCYVGSNICHLSPYISCKSCLLCSQTILIRWNEVEKKQKQFLHLEGSEMWGSFDCKLAFVGKWKTWGVFSPVGYGIVFRCFLKLAALACMPCLLRCSASALSMLGFSTSKGGKKKLQLQTPVLLAAPMLPHVMNFVPVASQCLQILCVSQVLYLVKRSDSSEDTSQQILVRWWCKHYLLLCMLTSKPNPGLRAGFGTRQRDLRWALVCCPNPVPVSILAKGRVSMPCLFGDNKSVTCPMTKLHWASIGAWCLWWGLHFASLGHIWKCKCPKCSADS